MTNRYGLFYLKGKPTAALVTDSEGPRWRLKVPEGEEMRRDQRQILFQWETGEAGDEPEALALLKTWQARLEDAIGTLDLDALHSRVPTSGETPLEQIAGMLPAPAGQKAERTLWDMATLFVALDQRPDRFRRGKHGFTALTPEQALERQRQMDEEKAREDWLAQVLSWKEGLEQGQWPDTGSEAETRFLDQLESLLAFSNQSPHWPLLSKPFGLKASQMDDHGVMLKGWLETAGRWSGWPGIFLAQAEVATGREAEQEAIALDLASRPTRTADRRDFRETATYSIDTPGALDLDDAISILESPPESLLVAVHISEPDHDLDGEHPLFLEAARRISTVYTPDQVFPMLPESLSSQRFSLMAGEDREAVSFLLRITAEEARLEGIERSVVRLRANLDYQQGDELIRSEPESWGRLAAYCQALAGLRKGGGAQITQRMDIRLDLSDPGNITLTRYHREGPAQRVVEELAILTNREAGRYCRNKGLPALYRIQPAGGGGPGNGGDSTPGKATQPGASFSLDGQPHTGLGCDRYIQVTCPIRRFPDMIMQRQIINHACEGRITYPSPARLEKWMRHAEDKLIRYAAAEQNIKNHWKRVFLTQHPEERLTGTIRRVVRQGEGRVWLEDFQMMAIGLLPMHSRTGDQLIFRLREVDPDRQRVVVEPLSR